ncbi:MAG: DUF1294 domain-containing protein [Planctomycetes bacterium]|nr:DUF1294 domain-containing protein [Planctomycetota bacterium]
MQTVILAAYAVASVATLAAWSLDKRRARRGGRRISERTLHLLSLFGGWPGALLGSRLFRHKTQKLSFRSAQWLIIGLHAAAWAWWWRS